MTTGNDLASLTVRMIVGRVVVGRLLSWATPNVRSWEGAAPPGCLGRPGRATWCIELVHPMLTVSSDAGRVEADLAGGRLGGPGCEAVVALWGYARTRWVRDRQSRRRWRLRRVICGVAGAHMCCCQWISCCAARMR